MTPTSIFQNRLLSRLPENEVALLVPLFERVACPRGLVIAEANTAIPFAFFLESGIASIVAQSPEGQRAEAGIIGREGFVHPALVLGSDRVPFDVKMQVVGMANRIPVAELVKACAANTALQQGMLLFAQASSVQSCFNSLSNAVHQLEERLARWLLMCHDRSDSDDIPLTHELMSIMLAVRLVSVTNALHVLEGNGFIELARGCVVVRNRAALEEFAGDAYGGAEAEYRRLLGPL